MVGPAVRLPLRTISSEHAFRPSQPSQQNVMRIQQPQRTKTPKEACVEANVDITICAQMAELPNDMLATIFTLLWLSWPNAPRLAVVCTTFKDMSWKVVRKINRKLLAAPGAVFNLAPHEPYLVPDGMYAATLQALGGPGLAHFAAFWALGERIAKRRMLQGDLCSLLDVQPNGRGGNGWLKNIAIDAFFSSYFPDATVAEEPGPKYMCSSMLSRDEYDTYTILTGSSCPALWKQNLNNATELHGVHNVGPNVHWVYFIIDMTKGRLTFFEPSSFVTEAEGKALLAALAVALSIPAIKVPRRWLPPPPPSQPPPHRTPHHQVWPVYIVKKGVLEQFDSKSCGVYACMFAYAYKHSRKLPPVTAAKLRDWRAFIADRIQDPAHAL